MRLSAAGPREPARDDAARSGLLHRLRPHAEYLELVPALALGVLRARARLDGEARLLHGGTLHRLATRFFFDLSKADALALFGFGALLGRELGALASFGRFACGDGRSLAGLARVALLADALVFELHQLLEGEVDALVSSLGTAGHAYLELSDTRRGRGLGAGWIRSPIGKFRPVPAREAHHDVARRVEEQRVHLNARPGQRHRRAVAP